MKSQRNCRRIHKDNSLKEVVGETPKNVFEEFLTKFLNIIWITEKNLKQLARNSWRIYWGNRETKLLNKFSSTVQGKYLNKRFWTNHRRNSWRNCRRGFWENCWMFLKKKKNSNVMKKLINALLQVCTIERNCRWK